MFSVFFLLLVTMYVGFMDQSDISYILEQLQEAIETKDWEIVLDTIETIKEFQDDDEYDIETDIAIE